MGVDGTGRKVSYRHTTDGAPVTAEGTLRPSPADGAPVTADGTARLSPADGAPVTTDGTARPSPGRARRVVPGH